MKKLASQDRQALIRLASSLKPGSSARRAILAGLTKQSNDDVNIPGKHIFERAGVYGDAKVWGKAKLFGKAEVYGYAKVYGEAQLYGDAEVWGDAKVYGEAEVYGNAKVYGDAKVFGKADISGTARLMGGEWDGSEGPITSGKWKAPGDPA